jgi:uncharacterized protein (TIGR00251 family)
MSWITTTAEGAVLTLRVVPRSSRDEVKGFQGDALKVRLTAPPVEGKANRALLNLVAGVLDVRPSRVLILSGKTGRTKRVLIAGVTEEMVRRKMAPGTRGGDES